MGVQEGGNIYSPTSSFNQFDNISILSDTSSVANNKNQQGGSKDIQDINKLVSMLTSESDATSTEANDLNVNINDFDTVTSVTATSVLENKLRDLFDNQMDLEMEGGAKKRRKKSKKVDVEEEAPKKKSKKRGSKKGSKKAKKASKKGSRKGSKKAKKASKKGSAGKARKGS